MKLPPRPAVPLAVQMDVLDRIEDRLKPVAPALDADQIVQALAPLTPDVAESVLRAAAEDHLAQLPRVCSSPDQFDFGWKRPTTVAQADQQTRPSPWVRQALRGSEKTALPMAALGGFLGILFLASSLGLGWKLAGLGLAAGVVGLGFWGVSRLYHRMEQASAATAVELAEHLWAQCAQSPAARSYLRAVHASACPLTLRGDVPQLLARMGAEKEAREAESRAQQDQITAEKRAQDRIQQIQRLGRFVDGGP